MSNLLPDGPVARQLTRVDGWRLSRPVLRQVVSALVFVAAIGFVGIGLSGGLAVAAGAVWGKPFVSGDADGVTYTPARCAEFREYYPQAPSCAAAATGHHYDEVVFYRSTAGVVGVLSLGGWLLATRRRRRRHTPFWPALPDGFVATIGAALSGVAAGALLVPAAALLALGSTRGAGAALSAGLVAGVTFAGFAVALWRALRRRSIVAT